MLVSLLKSIQKQRDKPHLQPKTTIIKILKNGYHYTSFPNNDNAQTHQLPLSNTETFYKRYWDTTRSKNDFLDIIRKSKIDISKSQENKLKYKQDFNTRMNKIKGWNELSKSTQQRDAMVFNEQPIQQVVHSTKEIEPNVNYSANYAFVNSSVYSNNSGYKNNNNRYNYNNSSRGGYNLSDVQIEEDKKQRFYSPMPNNKTKYGNNNKRNANNNNNNNSKINNTVSNSSQPYQQYQSYLHPSSSSQHQQYTQQGNNYLQTSPSPTPQLSSSTNINNVINMENVEIEIDRPINVRHSYSNNFKSRNNKKFLNTNNKNNESNPKYNNRYSNINTSQSLRDSNYSGRDPLNNSGSLSMSVSPRKKDKMFNINNHYFLVAEGEENEPIQPNTKFSLNYITQFQPWKISNETKLLPKELIERIDNYDICEKDYLDKSDDNDNNNITSSYQPRSRNVNQHEEEDTVQFISERNNNNINENSNSINIQPKQYSHNNYTNQQSSLGNYTLKTEDFQMTTNENLVDPENTLSDNEEHIILKSELPDISSSRCSIPNQFNFDEYEEDNVEQDIPIEPSFLNEISSSLSDLKYKTNLDNIKASILELLNKITMSNYNEIKNSLLAIITKENEKQEKFVDIVFSKAITEPNYNRLYAKLCKDIDKNLVNKKEKTKSHMRIKLIDKCKKNFRAEFKNNKRIMVGNVAFIAELIKVQMISKKVGVQCINNLIDKFLNQLTPEHPLSDVYLECIITLTEKYGSCILYNQRNRIRNDDLTKFENDIDDIVKILNTIAEKKEEKNIPSFLYYRLINLIDKANNGWKPTSAEKFEEELKHIVDTPTQSADTHNNNNTNTNDNNINTSNTNNNLNNSSSNNVLSNSQNIPSSTFVPIDINSSYNANNDNNTNSNNNLSSSAVFSQTFPQHHTTNTNNSNNHNSMFSSTGNSFHSSQQSHPAKFTTSIYLDLINFEKHFFPNKGNRINYDWNTIEKLRHKEKAKMYDIIFSYVEAMNKYLNNNHDQYSGERYIGIIFEYYSRYLTQTECDSIVEKVNEKLKHLSTEMNTMNHTLDIWTCVMYYLMENKIYFMKNFNYFCKDTKDNIKCILTLMINIANYNNANKNIYLKEARATKIMKNNKELLDSYN